MRTFDPWIGSRYLTDGVRGVRVLILGESHYGLAGTEQADTTTGVIRWYGQLKRFRFFTATQRLVTGLNHRPSDEERSEFWERVAFYNFVQTFPGPAPRWRPTPQMWAAAGEPFLQTLAELNPQMVLILGRQLHRNLPALPTGVVACAVQHPSSRGFRYADWQPVVNAALEAIKIVPPGGHP